MQDHKLMCETITRAAVELFKIVLLDYAHKTFGRDLENFPMIELAGQIVPYKVPGLEFYYDGEADPGRALVLGKDVGLYWYSDSKVDLERLDGNTKKEVQPAEYFNFAGEAIRSMRSAKKRKDRFDPSSN